MRTVLLLCVLLTTIWAIDLPPSFKRCPVSAELDGKPNECLREAIYDAIVRLQAGDAQLGVETLDPLRVKLITVERGENSPVAVKLTFKDCVLRGIRDLQVDSITGNQSKPEHFSLKGTGHSPQLSLVGPYHVEGRVLLLPIQGHGHSNLTLDNVQAEFSVKGERQEKDGVRYLKVTQMKLNIKSTSRAWIYLGGLFNGDKALGDNMNLFLNQNWQELFTELRPSISQAFGSIVQQYARHILESIPFDRIFITS